MVEDEQHLAEGLRFNLEAEGYGVQVAETGEAALEAVTRRSRRFRCDGAGRDAARQGWLHRHFGTAPGRPVHAHPDSDRSRPSRTTFCRASPRAPTII